MTMTIRASRASPGTTTTPVNSSSPPWSTTPSPCWPPSTGVELVGEAADAVGLLALVAGQDVEPGESDGTWRIAQRTAKDRVISTVDPDSRHIHKSRAFLPQRLQGSRLGRTGHRADLRPAAHSRQRPRRPDRCRTDEQRTAKADRCSPMPPTARAQTRVALKRRHRLAIKPWPMADTGRFGRDDRAGAGPREGRH